jgi:bifunctional non-homologous end joining protein LigD
MKRVRTRALAAKESEMPGFIQPQLATFKSRPPKGDQWLHEIKYDGYRVQIHLNKGKRKVYSRTGLDWTKRFSLIAGALDIPGQAIIDGEVVVIHEGRTNFSELQAELAAGHQDRLLFYAFDLLWRNGHLRKLPQIERKQMLADLLEDIEPPVIYSQHLAGDGERIFEHAARCSHPRATASPLSRETPRERRAAPQNEVDNRTFMESFV